jgi:hypothetical protein
MTIRTFYAPKIYTALADIAVKNGLSVKEVETIFLRKMCEEIAGFKCDHRVIGTSKKTGLPFCKECWTRMEMITQPVYSYKDRKIVKEGTYRPLTTFLDIMKELK